MTPEPGRRLPPWGWVEWVLVAQTALPAVLYLPGAQAVRTPVRAAPYLIALLPLLFPGPRPRVPHPAAGLGVVIVALYAVMVAHPGTPGLAAGVGHAALSAAVIAPLFWAPGRVAGPAHLWRLLLLMLACNGVNATVGVLQVYDPDRWMPARFSAAVESELDRYTYAGPGGVRVVRPPGLFDTPGAVCGAGAVAGVLGLVVALTPGRRWVRAASLGLAFAGVTALYLTQVRSNFIIMVFALLATAGMLAVQGRAGRAGALAGLAVGLPAASLGLAVALGGEGVAARFATLIEADPQDLYQRNRGIGSQYTFAQQLDEAPLGEGMGQWGTTAGALGGGKFFVEVQYVAWMIDGGVPLVLLYALTLGVNSWWELRTAALAGPRLGPPAAAVCGLNLGVVVLCASFVPFASQIGIQYWLLAGALHGAAYQSAGGRA